MLNGLSSQEALDRLKKYGPNAVADTAANPLVLLLNKFWAPVPWMLEVAIVFQIFLHEYIEAAVIAGLLVFNALLGFFQEGRAQATIAALRSKLALNASVRRDGAWKILSAADLVPDDIIKISLGAVVAADVLLLEGAILLDQSMITGESMPIEAKAGTQTYAGALVRRGEAIAKVTATGTHTKFGRTAELVRTAHVVSSQQKAVFQVVRNLAFFNGAVIVFIMLYAHALHLPLREIIPLALTAVLASIPVALPASFTLAAAISAHALAKRGVLPTRLSAVDEAGTMNVLCSDKTGTLTRNELAVVGVGPEPGFSDEQVLAMAALASSEGGQDPLDTAIRLAVLHNKVANQPKLIRFVPFDPETKMSEATVVDANGQEIRIVKGSVTVVCSLIQSPADACQSATGLVAKGFRVLAVAQGLPNQMQLAGVIAFSDSPRDDAASLIKQLQNLGVRVVMVTGDAPQTAEVVAKSVGLAGAVCPPGKIPERVNPQDFTVFAGILPEDKYNLVVAFQKEGYVVGMCGDGANDAPALRQAQMGIAVSTATDVAKSAAGMVLTEPGLGGIVDAVKEGRISFQRILTYALRSIIGKVISVLFLAIGLIMTGHAILTPMLMVILMITGDFLAMSSTTDNVRPSAKPNTWKIDKLTIAGIVVGLCGLVFSTGILALGKFSFGMDIKTLITLAFVIRVFNNQAVFYVIRERESFWSSRPSRWVILSSIIDVSIAVTLSVCGIAMTSLPISIVLGAFVVTVGYVFVMDIIKVSLFNRLGIA